MSKKHAKPSPSAILEKFQKELDQLGENLVNEAQTTLDVVNDETPDEEEAVERLFRMQSALYETKEKLFDLHNRIDAAGEQFASRGVGDDIMFELFSVTMGCLMTYLEADREFINISQLIGENVNFGIDEDNGEDFEDDFDEEGEDLDSVETGFFDPHAFQEDPQLLEEYQTIVKALETLQEERPLTPAGQRQFDLLRALIARKQAH